MHGRLGDAEVSLHVGFDGRPVVDLRAGMNEPNVLALLFGEFVMQEMAR
ncbi:MAG: hypothetical protein OXL68_21665 [Paracoccaceae bacterium]|nr:hypothetical protein [Paracoccaceae bacterium]